MVQMRLVLASLSAIAAAACGGSSEKPAPRSAIVELRPAQPTDAKAVPWGAAVPDAAVELEIAAWLAGVGTGETRPPGMLTIGAGLWSVVGEDASIAELGIPATFRVTVRGETYALPGRTILEKDSAAALASHALQVTAAYFVEGEVGPATEDERRLFYAGIPFEIAGKPVTIVRRDGERLLVFVDDDTVWLDLLEPWQRLFGETVPFSDEALPEK